MRTAMCKGATDLVIYSDFRVGITPVQSSHFAQVVATGQLHHLELHRHLLLQRHEVQLAARQSAQVSEAEPSSSSSSCPQTAFHGLPLPTELLYLYN